MNLHFNRLFPILLQIWLATLCYFMISLAQFYLLITQLITSYIIQTLMYKKMYMCKQNFKLSKFIKPLFGTNRRFEKSTFSESVFPFLPVTCVWGNIEISIFCLYCSLYNSCLKFEKQSLFQFRLGKKYL